MSDRAFSLSTSGTEPLRSWRDELEAIGAAGEVVSAVGVVLTLVYLAYQIKQNTIQLEQNTITARAAAQTASNVTLRENRQSIFQTSEMASIFKTGNADPTRSNRRRRLQRSRASSAHS